MSLNIEEENIYQIKQGFFSELKRLMFLDSDYMMQVLNDKKYHYSKCQNPKLDKTKIQISFSWDGKSRILIGKIDKIEMVYKRMIGEISVDDFNNWIKSSKYTKSVTAGAITQLISDKRGSIKISNDKNNNNKIDDKEAIRSIDDKNLESSYKVKKDVKEINKKDVIYMELEESSQIKNITEKHVIKNYKKDSILICNQNLIQNKQENNKLNEYAENKFDEYKNKNNILNIKIYEETNNYDKNVLNISENDYFDEKSIIYLNNKPETPKFSFKSLLLDYPEIKTYNISTKFKEINRLSPDMINYKIKQKFYRNDTFNVYNSIIPICLSDQSDLYNSKNSMRYFIFSLRKSDEQIKISIENANTKPNIKCKIKTINNCSNVKITIDTNSTKIYNSNKKKIKQSDKSSKEIISNKNIDEKNIDKLAKEVNKISDQTHISELKLFNLEKKYELELARLESSKTKFTKFTCTYFKTISNLNIQLKSPRNSDVNYINSNDISQFVFSIYSKLNISVEKFDSLILIAQTGILNGYLFSIKDMRYYESNQIIDFQHKQSSLLKYLIQERYDNCSYMNNLLNQFANYQRNNPDFLKEIKFLENHFQVLNSLNSIDNLSEGLITIAENFYAFFDCLCELRIKYIYLYDQIINQYKLQKKLLYINYK